MILYSRSSTEVFFHDFNIYIYMTLLREIFIYYSDGTIIGSKMVPNWYHLFAGCHFLYHHRPLLCLPHHFPYHHPQVFQQVHLPMYHVYPIQLTRISLKLRLKND